MSRYLTSRCYQDKKVFCSRAFRVAAPTVFNPLPQDIRSTDNISTFCHLLKTFYSRNAFDRLALLLAPQIQYNCWHCVRKEITYLPSYLNSWVANQTVQLNTYRLLARFQCTAFLITKATSPLTVPTALMLCCLCLFLCARRCRRMTL